MKEQFNDDINSLTGARSSDSGGKPTPIDESAPDAFDRNWNWEFEVRPLGPSETAKCFVTMGADDLATLTVDQKEIMNLGPRGRKEAVPMIRRKPHLTSRAGSMRLIWNIKTLPSKTIRRMLPSLPLI